LYVRKGIIDQIDPPFIDLRSATWTSANSFKLAEGAKRFENWESYVAGRVGLMAAVKYARGIGLKNIEARVESLGKSLRTSLEALNGVEVHDLGEKKCGIVTFTKAGAAPTEIYDKLRQSGINVSVSGMTSARLDLEPRNLAALTRASVHYFNTQAEIDVFVKAIDMA
ncbi:MAG: aminotransferase class V-fold PLP-dependent enzyme, partial [Anderseniella sp.]